MSWLLKKGRKRRLPSVQQPPTAFTMYPFNAPLSGSQQCRTFSTSPMSQIHLGQFAKTPRWLSTDRSNLGQAKHIPWPDELDSDITVTTKFFAPEDNLTGRTSTQRSPTEAPATEESAPALPFSSDLYAQLPSHLRSTEITRLAAERALGGGPPPGITPGARSRRFLMRRSQRLRRHYVQRGGRLRVTTIDRQKQIRIKRSRLGLSATPGIIENVASSVSRARLALRKPRRKDLVRKLKRRDTENVDEQTLYEAFLFPFSKKHPNGWWRDGPRAALRNTNAVSERRQLTILRFLEARLDPAFTILKKSVLPRWRQEIWSVMLGLRSAESEAVGQVSVRRGQLETVFQDMIARRESGMPRMRDDKLWQNVVASTSNDWAHSIESLVPEQQDLWRITRRKFRAHLTRQSGLSSTRTILKQKSKERSEAHFAFLKQTRESYFEESNKFLGRATREIWLAAVGATNLRQSSAHAVAWGVSLDDLEIAVTRRRVLRKARLSMPYIDNRKALRRIRYSLARSALQSKHSILRDLRHRRHPSLYYFGVRKARPEPPPIAIQLSRIEESTGRLALTSDSQNHYRLDAAKVVAFIRAAEEAMTAMEVEMSNLHAELYGLLTKVPAKLASGFFNGNRYRLDNSDIPMFIRRAEKVIAANQMKMKEWLAETAMLTRVPANEFHELFSMSSGTIRLRLPGVARREISNNTRTVESGVEDITHSARLREAADFSISESGMMDQSLSDISPQFRGPLRPSSRLQAPLRRQHNLEEPSAPREDVDASKDTQRQSVQPRPTKLTHLTSRGTAHMVSVSAKAETKRTAVAIGRVVFSSKHTYDLVTGAALKKGDVLAVSRIAGIQASKLCPSIIPLCHPIMISSVVVDVEPFYHEAKSECGIEVEAKVECTGQTGVEMEALTAVMGASLTVVDMIKAVDKSAVIQGVKVVYKAGGKSGDWVDEEWRSRKEKH